MVAGVVRGHLGTGNSVLQWAKEVDATRIVRQLTVKAAALTPDVGSLTYAVCARSDVHQLPLGAIAVTAADIFADP